MGRQGAQSVIINIARVVVDGPHAGVRQYDRGFGEGQHLVEHEVRGVAGVEHNAQAVGLCHKGLAGRRQTAPLDLVGCGIGEVVILEMHWPHHAYTKRIEGAHQADVASHWRAVFHAEEHKALLGRQDRGHVIGLERDGELRAVLGDHLMDLSGADQAEITSFGISHRAARTLGRKDGEEPTIDAALDHARQVDLTAVDLVVMAIKDVPAGLMEQGGGVVVSIEHDGVAVGGCHCG